MPLKINHRQVKVQTGSRLHFGLTRIRPDSQNSMKYGGVGVMIDDPITTVEVESADSFSTVGSDRVAAFAADWASTRGLSLNQLACRVSVLTQAQAHCGLGSGTQLAHAITQGLELFFEDIANKNNGVDSLPASQLAGHLNRGNRSMIGSFGFERGGLIVDSGPAGNGPPKLAFCNPLPIEWRTVIVCHRQAGKKFGIAEKAAFRDLINNPSQRSKQERIEKKLVEMIDFEIIPSAQSANFEQFCESLHDYGKLSGEFYTKVQGGIYNGPVITSVIDDVLRMGGQGVGQSSWGPVVFSWAADEPSANKLRNRFASHFGEQAMVWISRVRNEPASISQSCDLHESSK